ncbi:MAG TPA: hypothetical protein VEU33_29235 [Archangium sp.]|nr:hypothetical protein [Archangium sp.]
MTFPFKNLVFEGAGVRNHRSLRWPGGLQPPDARPDPIHTLHDFAGSFFASLLSSREIDLMNSPANLARSIRINDLGLKPTELGITREQKRALMHQGEQATRAFLERDTASHSVA